MQVSLRIENFKIAIDLNEKLRVNRFLMDNVAEKAATEPENRLTSEKLFADYAVFRIYFEQKCCSKKWTKQSNVGQIDEIPKEQHDRNCE